MRTKRIISNYLFVAIILFGIVSIHEHYSTGLNSLSWTEIPVYIGMAFTVRYLIRNC